MAPRAFETLIEIEFSDRSVQEYFFEAAMTEREVHDALDPILEEWRGRSTKEVLSPIYVSRWNGGKIESQEIRLLSPTE